MFHVHFRPEGISVDSTEIKSRDDPYISWLCLPSQRALTALILSHGLEILDPYLLWLTADYIAEPIAHTFNQSLHTNSIPKIWKAVNVTHPLKGEDPSETISND